MTSEMWIAVISFAGTLVGSGLGLLASARLTSYRIAQLHTSREAMREEIRSLEESGKKGE